MQPDGHVISWVEFQNAFRAHHIPKGLMERKLNEFLALIQGTHTVLQYAQTFNHLCQYAGYHADNDAKKQDRFLRGLSTKLKERLNLVKANTFSELVNIALTQDDCIMAHRAEKKRKTPLDPRVLSHRDIMLFPTHSSEHPSRMPHLADLFSGRPNSKEVIDLPCLRNSRNSLVHGQMLNNFNREAALIVVSIAGVRIISSEIVLGPKSLSKGRILIKITRARARGQ
jgi:hypothetical protein